VQFVYCPVDRVVIERRPAEEPPGSAEAGHSHAFGVGFIGEDHDAVRVRERPLALVVGIAGEAAGALAAQDFAVAVGSDWGVGCDRSGEPTYTSVLGLEKRVENPTPDGPRFLTVGVKGDDFQLVLWPGTPGQAEPAMGRPPASITIETDNCRKTVEELKSRGVEFVSDVLEFPWGYVAQFQDPDGNRLQIREGR
jgi:predicted enzyme related to lactoylglutathione lyase